MVMRQLSIRCLGGCMTTAIVTVNPLPGSITGTASVCPGSTTTLSDEGGGAWSSGSLPVSYRYYGYGRCIRRSAGYFHHHLYIRYRLYHHHYCYGKLFAGSYYRHFKCMCGFCNNIKRWQRRMEQWQHEV